VDINDHFTAATIETTTKDTFTKQSLLVNIIIRADYLQNHVQINRMDWMNQIGIFGGIAGFYSSILAIIVGYFAEIDYLTAFIKRLFLEE